ncbi:MAG: nucleotidyltransferase domain-containing protein [Devosia nanyangense]|uniref:Nucleotidyltransferase domain-containing protein n=1 Tax=Devosia nanyangense TaxID=1228055 RepID=A0A933L4Q0_9HYPH|nr:nucleotidyltransferase domain-containing protein [Devosia nanyangense]
MTLELADRQLEDVVSKRAAARLRAFRRDAERLLPGRVTEVVLFGSRARGEARRDSDYDVAVFVEGLEESWPTTRVLVEASYPHLVKGYYISPVALPSDFIARKEAALAYAIAREGIKVP